MKQLIKQQQNSLKNRPRFNLRNLAISCQTFIANLLLRNPHSRIADSRYWWDSYPDVDSVKYYKDMIH